ncbi:MAG TPA: PKD domain-containing protein [Dehalococcoidia bacterium]|nr:PKD domain-containing protein [Dehalococcoidia bacterium]
MRRKAFTVALALLAVAGCGGSERVPTTPSVPPPPPPVPAAPVARLAVKIDSRNSPVAIQDLSNVTFDATGSSGTGLRYSLDFGDGTGVDEPIGRHVYTVSRTYTARAIITDSLGRTDSVSVNVVVRNVQGRWYNGFYNYNRGRYEERYLDIRSQSGTSLEGIYTHPERFMTRFDGVLSGERDIMLKLEGNTITFTGADGNGIDGEVTALSLLVRGGSADGLTLQFKKVTWATSVFSLGLPAFPFVSPPRTALASALW